MTSIAVVHIGHRLNGIGGPLDFDTLSLVDTGRGSIACKILLDQTRQSNTIQYWSTGMAGCSPISLDPHTTLAEVNAERVSQILDSALMEAGIPEKMILFRRICTLSALHEIHEAESMIRQTGVEIVHVVSSKFYFDVYDVIWKLVAQRCGVTLIIEPIAHAQGMIKPDLEKFKEETFHPPCLIKLAQFGRLGLFLASRLADYAERARYRQRCREALRSVLR